MVKDIERINIQHKVRLGTFNLFQFSRSTAPAVKLLSKYKQQNQTYILYSKKYYTKDDTSTKKKNIKNPSLIVSSVAGATELANIIVFQFLKVHWQTHPAGF